MASTSTTADRSERESTNTCQEITPSPSLKSSFPSLCSSCFEWVSSFIPWRSVQSNSIASTSTTARIPENEVMGTFEGITPSDAFMGVAPSAFASTTDLIPENEVLGAFEVIAPPASPSTTDLIPKNKVMDALEGIIPSGAYKGVAPSTAAFTTDLIPENKVMDVFEGIVPSGAYKGVAPSASASTTELTLENKVMDAFEGIVLSGAYNGVAPSAAASTTDRIPENKVLGAFKGIVPPNAYKGVASSVAPSTTDLIPENKVMDVFEGIVPSGTYKGVPPSASASDLIPENKVMDAFEGIVRSGAFEGMAPSAAASTTDLIPENKVLGAFEVITPFPTTSTSDLISENKFLGAFEVITLPAATSTSDLVPKNEVMGAFEVITTFVSTPAADLTSENKVLGAFEVIAPSTSTSTIDLIPKNADVGAFEGIAPSAFASTSTLIQKPCYDVFINHRGPDVKHTLASSIYNTLNNMKVAAFLDSEELEYGDVLPTTLEAAMRSASLHIAIFSENYAKSSWCLAELSFMLKTGAKIIPVFYHVEPTDLRWVAQGKGIYVDAFLQYENKRRYSPEKLQEWKKALHDVSFYIGEIIKNNKYHTLFDEKRLLKNIADCVAKVINNVPLVVAKYPVGLKETVQDFEMNTLQSAEGDHGVQIVGIWGMGGSGKTTLAKELFNKISPSMERASFVFDVRDGATKGLLHNKQIKLLNDLGAHGVAFDNIEEGMGFLSRHLRTVRVLIVLDDVDHVEQLDALLPVKDSLRRGSLIIVTTRAYDVLKSWGISSTYKMRPLDPSHAEQLFCWHAFLKSCPLDGFKELVEKFLKECRGLPLSLKVFGGQLYGESSKECWESELHKISRILPDDIKQRLKISYDALDYEEKEMFLDIACFFIEEKSSLAIEIWNGLKWSGLRNWKKLLYKCLVEFDDDNRIRMHDHLRDLGRDIANQQSPYRLWFPQQIINVQKQEEKRMGIQGIMATSTRIRWTNYVDEGKPCPIMAHITGEIDEFRICCSHGELMVNTNAGIWSLTPSLIGLKFLVISGDCFNQVMGEVSRELLWLRWFQIGQRNLPSQLSLKKLRVLEFFEERGENHLEELWSETDGVAPVHLRERVISQCFEFQGFPNSIGRLNHLKKIVIIKGYKISNLPEEFCLLQSLEHLVLSRCKILSSLPSNFGNLRNLRHLSLYDCGKLRKLPVSFKNLILLEHLNLGGCTQLTFATEDLNILENMTKLEFLRLSECEQLEELPRHITNQASLRQLYLNGTSLRELPVNIGQLSKLTEMTLGSLFLTSLPTSLGDLSSLTDLSIWDCPKLESLPDSVGRLNLLKELEIQNVGVKSLPKSVRQLNNLQRLLISNCPIAELDFGAASLASGLSNLEMILLEETEVCRVSISEDCCPRLESLILENNHHLKEIEGLPKTAESISMINCEMLKKIPSFARLTSLEQFVLGGCYQVEKIEGLENCTRLEVLRVDTCWEVPGIASLEYMHKLTRVKFTTNKGSAIEHCIQTIQKWPDEIEICTRAVPDAASLINSLLSPDHLVVIDSISNQKNESTPKLLQKHSCNGDAIMLCFVVNCVSSEMPIWTSHDGSGHCYKLYEGRWVWIGLFTQRSSSTWFTAQEFSIEGSGGECKEEDEVEKGVVVKGEEQRVVKAFRSLMTLLCS